MKTGRAYIIQVCLVAVALFLFAGAAAASSISDIRIIMDPGVPAPAQGNFNILQSTNTQYLMNWVSCNPKVDPGFPDTYSACIGIINETGAPINTIAIGFTVPKTPPGNVLVGQPLACSTSGVNLTSNTCPPLTSMTAGEDVDATFTGGQPIANNTLFFIGEDGVSLANMANVPLSVTATATATAGEPSELVLLAMDFLVFGLMCEWWRRRRQAHAE